MGRMRKHYRDIVRAQAALRGVKPSKAVSEWRRIWGLFPGFSGKKKQKPGSRQTILAYPASGFTRLTKSEIEARRPYGRKR